MFPPPTDEVTTPSNPQQSVPTVQAVLTTVTTATQFSQTTVTTATQFPEFGQRQTGKEPDRPSPMGNCEPAEVSYCARNRPIDSFPVINNNPIQFNPQNNTTPISTREKVGGDKRKISTLRQPNPKTHVEFDAEQHAEPQQNQQMAYSINRTLRKIKNVVLGNNSKHRKHHYGSADKTNVTL